MSCIHNPRPPLLVSTGRVHNGYHRYVPQSPVPEENTKPRLQKAMIRGAIEIASIIFLFYSNLLMGQYTAGNNAVPLSFALHQIFTAKSLTIAVTSALIGYAVFEYLRNRT